jgi:hypothetical protein
MKKRLSIFLFVFAVLFFGSCTDLSVDDEGVLKADLPSDFDWKEYAEINNDMASSQIIVKIREENKAFSGTDSAQKAIENCANLLQSETLAQEIYLKYAGCPEQGWNRDEKCPGIYANNSNYKKPTIEKTVVKVIKINRETEKRDTSITEISDTTSWQCVMGTNAACLITETITRDMTGDTTTEKRDTTKQNCIINPNSEICWNGGWEEFKGMLQDTLPKYLDKKPTAISFAPIKTMCLFIPKAEDASKVLGYLESESVKLDSVLIIKSYKLYGRNDGRPYKYCGQASCKEKTQELADKRGTNYYDYGRYTFCLNKTDEKICMVQ